MSDTARVLIVEDDERVNAHLCAAIAEQPDLELFGSATTLHGAASSLGRRLPDVALVDLGLPDGDGSELIRWLAAQSPPIDSLVLTVFGDEQHVVAAIEAGARGYLLKDESLSGIADATRAVLRGESPLSPAVARFILQRARPSTPDNGSTRPMLTPTELEVLRLIAKGYSAPEIAGLRNMAPSTVHVHIKHIYRKLSVHSRGEAVFEALQLGLIQAGR